MERRQWHDDAMNEPHSAQPGPAAEALASVPPAYDPRRSAPPRTSGERRALAVIGGLLAGAGFGFGIALLMHIIEESQPQNFNGIGGDVFAAVVLAGPLFGLGLGVALASLIPDPQPAPAGHPQAQPAAMPPEGVPTAEGPGPAEAAADT
jgi:hypothetical protein